MTTLAQSAAQSPAQSAAQSPAESAAGLRAGARTMAPMLLAFLPFGLLVGAAVRASESPLAAWLSTWTIYGGAAHLAVLDVLAGGAAAVTAAVVGLLVNVRLAAYAVSLAPHWRDTGVPARLGAAVVLTDVTWSLAHQHPGPGPATRRFYVGAALTLWLGWPVMVTVGTVVGPVVEQVPAATLLPALCLGTLVVPHLRSRPGLAAGAAAVLVAVVTAPLGSGPALVLVAVAGAAAGVMADRRRR